MSPEPVAGGAVRRREQAFGEKIWLLFVIISECIVKSHTVKLFLTLKLIQLSNCDQLMTYLRPNLCFKIVLHFGRKSRTHTLKDGAWSWQRGKALSGAGSQLPMARSAGQ